MKSLLAITAMIEVGVALALLAVPSLVVKLLFGSPLETAAAVALGRLGGAALLALSMACWRSRADATSKAARGVAVAMLLYNIAAVVVLAMAGAYSKLVGVALWPAVGFHVVMTGWCFVCLRNKVFAKPLGTPRMTNLH